MSANHVLLQRLEVSNSTSTVVSFRNIPQTGYTDLKIVVSGRTVRSGTDRSNDFLLTFNDSASGYSRKDLGDSPVRSTGGSSLSNIGRIQMPSDDATANTFGNAEIYIANYTSSQNKAVTIDNVSQDNNTYGPTWLVAGLWSSSTPVYSISLTADQSGTITAGSTFSLYGIAKLGTTPAIAPKATGGDIIVNDGEYWYHAYFNSGYFNAKSSLNCDMLLVAGGGGGGGTGNGTNGGYPAAGGGGAGGYRLLTSQFLSLGNYSVAVGAGGAGKYQTGGAGASGGNSYIGSYSATGGGGGASHASTALSGGSGGGASTNAGSGGSGNAGSYSPVEGYAGGSYTSGDGGAGGGGATSAGGGVTSTSGGAGGAGSNSAATWLQTIGFTGTSGYLAGGGGGGAYSGGTVGSGAAGGGNGGLYGSTGATSATANTGSGGGGASQNGVSSNLTGGNGGSGIVIVRYAMA